MKYEIVGVILKPVAENPLGGCIGGLIALFFAIMMPLLCCNFVGVKAGLWNDMFSAEEQNRPPPRKPGPVRYGKEVLQPSVKISEDGQTCWLVVPADRPEGVEAIDTTGRKFLITIGDQIEMEIGGEANIGRGSFGPEGESHYQDRNVDGPFFDRVGGLEFSIGSLSSNRYLAYINKRFKASHTGVPVFRVIETPSGYNDGNFGGFTVKMFKK